LSSAKDEVLLTATAQNLRCLRSSSAVRRHRWPPSVGVRQIRYRRQRRNSLSGRTGQEYGQNSPPHPIANSNRVLQHIFPSIANISGQCRHFRLP
jgi:hypothetical protein